MNGRRERGATPSGSRLTTSSAQPSPDRDPGLAHRLLRLGDRVLAVVEDRGREHRVGAAVVIPSTRCASSPTPPEAITGTPTASATARVSSSS